MFRCYNKIPHDKRIALMLVLIVDHVFLFKIRSIPPEIGDLVELRELMLNNNLLRSIPTEVGKLFQLLVSANNTPL